MSEFFGEYLASFREMFGCPNSRLRLHDFDWNIGSRGWWMYCTRCARPIGGAS